MITIKSAQEIEKMRLTCRLAANTLVYLEKNLRIGMSTEDINTLCHDYILRHGAIPATLGYKGYPKSLCTSRNDVICHGIPSPTEFLQDGDIINLDVTTILDGFHGDTNRTFLIGNVSQPAKKLVEVTYQAMMAGIDQVKPGGRLGDIGAAIQSVAEPLGYTVVYEFCGHGIGRKFHEDPQVSHVGRQGTGIRMKPGMTFTIEPMINMGVAESEILKDGWTALTKDRKWSAQFEHTILVTDSGYEILTLPDVD
jgi:methionyl aminopeptidase